MNLFEDSWTCAKQTTKEQGSPARRMAQKKSNAGESLSADSANPHLFHCDTEVDWSSCLSCWVWHNTAPRPGECGQKWACHALPPPSVSLCPTSFFSRQMLRPCWDHGNHLLMARPSWGWAHEWLHGTHANKHISEDQPQKCLYPYLTNSINIHKYISQ